MADGGELRAFFEGAKEPAAQALEDVSEAYGDFVGTTARNVEDSVGTVENAEGANVNAIKARLPAGDGAAGGGTGTGGPTEPGLPAYLKKRFDEGNAFNEENWPRYPYNEITLENGKRIDSYVPDEEIVERKYTQLASVKPETAKGYIDSLRGKYEPGQMIADTPKNRGVGLANEEFQGDHILEVPPQNQPIPSEIIQYAARRGVVIRDTNGKVYR